MRRSCINRFITFMVKAFTCSQRSEFVHMINLLGFFRRCQHNDSQCIRVCVWSSSACTRVLWLHGPPRERPSSLGPRVTGSIGAQRCGKHQHRGPAVDVVAATYTTERNGCDHRTAVDAHQPTLPTTECSTRETLRGRHSGKKPRDTSQRECH